GIWGEVKMARFILQRLLGVIPVLFGVTLIVFFMIRLIPGNPVILSLGTSATPAEVHLLEAQLGLNKPWWSQYGAYIGGLLHGNLGLSMQSGLSVSSELAQRFPATLELASAALVIAVVLGYTFGIFASLKPNGVMARTIVIVSTIFLAVPQFWLGLILIMFFSLMLRWLPVFGYGGLSHLILPALSVGLVAAAVNVRVVRTAMVEVLGADYVRTATAKGLRPQKVVIKHALRNALIPTITIIGLQLGFLLSGTVIVEQLFGWPGVGSLLISAIEARDYTLVQGGVLYLALIFIFANLLVDLLYALVDPQVQFS
ncbi:MAG: ABC transporter permease, partial [Sulfobacillus sp.]